MCVIFDGGLPDHPVGHSDLGGDESHVCNEKESSDHGRKVPGAEKGEDHDTRVQNDGQSLEDLGERCGW